MNIINGCLDLVLTDKQSGEEWECSYDCSYIENLTRKTGNYKQFEVFTAMLKSGILKTSESITLELLTYEDLEGMRVQRRHYSSTRLLANNNNRRYLIVTYSVEFDKINYPLPLEYCGPPDPVILQATIRRLETALHTAHAELNAKSNSSDKHKIKVLKKRVEEITTENLRLTEELRQLSKIFKNPNAQVYTFQNAIAQIEKNLVSERKSHHKLLQKLQTEKSYLLSQVEKLKGSEKALKNKLQETSRQPPIARKNFKSKRLSASKSYDPVINTIYQRKSVLTLPKMNKFDQKQRSRSASPRIVYNNYDNVSEQSHRSNSRRSRSSSASGQKSRNQDLQYNGIGPNSQGSTPAGSPRNSRKASPQSYRSSQKNYEPEVHRRRSRKQNSPSRSISPIIMNLQKKVNGMFRVEQTKKYIK